MLYFGIGVLLMDLCLYWVHRVGHRPGWIGSKLHMTRHHRIYSTSLKPSVRATTTSWLPRVSDLDLSVLLVIIPTILELCQLRDMALGAVCAAGAAFLLHAAAHADSVYCPQSYKDIHCLHHSQRSCNFGVLTPLGDLIFGSWVEM